MNRIRRAGDEAAHRVTGLESSSAQLAKTLCTQGRGAFSQGGCLPPSVNYARGCTQRITRRQRDRDRTRGKGEEGLVVSLKFIGRGSSRVSTTVRMVLLMLRANRRLERLRQKTDPGPNPGRSKKCLPRKCLAMRRLYPFCRWRL